MTGHDPRCLFISDVHLLPAEPAKTERFLGFLREEARRPGRLYIIGDLFDFWVGPQHLELPDYQPVLDALRRLSGSALKIHFVPGNRDYQTGPEFARAARVELHEARVEVALGGRRVHLEHGDFLYNRNPRYSAYRRIAGARGARRLIAGIPKTVALPLARGLRKVSRRDTPEVPFRSAEDLLEPVKPLFARGIDVVVCGHLHRAAHLTAREGKRPCDLFLLGEWATGTPHLRYEEGGFELAAE